MSELPLNGRNPLQLAGLIHEILPYAKKGAISSQKIHMIANRYVELVTLAPKAS
jgi:hypothetical protein